MALAFGCLVVALSFAGLGFVFFVLRAFAQRRAVEEARRRQVWTDAEAHRLTMERQQIEARQREATERERERVAHRAALVQRLGADAVAAIEQRRLWVGASEEVVRLMFGAPDVVDEKVMKTKTKRILKWRDHAHAGRFHTKVTIDDGAVVGWER